MVLTGASTYVKYDFETGYGSGGSPDKKFGLQDKVTSLTLTHNRINLAQLNSNYLDKFAYGQQQGTCSVGFVLSNPWVFGTILGAPVTTGSSAPYTHTYTPSSNPKTARTIEIEVGLNAGTDIVRNLKGGIVNSINLSASIGASVDCTADVTYGNEGQVTTSLGATPTKPTSEFPYTFAHAVITVGDVELAQCQDFTLNLTQNAELLYRLGSHSAVDSFKRVLDITGSFRTTFVNSVLLAKVLQQAKKGTYAETIGGTIEFKAVFTNTANEKITITGTGLAPTDHSVSGLEPVEPIFEEINWQMKEVTVVATSPTAAEE